MHKDIKMQKEIIQSPVCHCAGSKTEPVQSVANMLCCKMSVATGAADFLGSLLIVNGVAKYCFDGSQMLAAELCCTRAIQSARLIQVTKRKNTATHRQCFADLCRAYLALWVSGVLGIEQVVQTRKRLTKTNIVFLAFWLLCRGSVRYHQYRQNRAFWCATALSD